LTDNVQVHVPLTFCYANTPYDESVYSRFSSNGCAAGNTLEEALLQGFLELVERDAVAIWWYNRISRPGVSLGLLSTDNKKRITDTLAEEWDYWVLDLTHDFEIPVMAAVSRHKLNRTFRLGFGCHINPVIACQRALTELCQLIAIKNRGPAVFDFDAIKDEPFLFPDKENLDKHFSDYAAIVHADIRDDVNYCIEKASRINLKTLAVDYTRPDIPIYTVRAIIPGLAHIWPQFGNARLYAVPVAMGWKNSPLTEEQLNPQTLLV
jgi:ribosomal protein S12 methylthiotransferase accessory factor